MAQCQALVYADPTFKAHSHLAPSPCRTPAGVKKAPNGAILGAYCRHHFEQRYPYVGQCRGCRWWTPIEDDDGLGCCSGLGTFDARLPIRLHISGGRGAAVITGELFGCNQWSEPEGG